MLEDKKNISEKVKNNAIIAYLFIIVNILFLFSKNNILLNNDFVKSHTKTAILIHIGFIINTIIFAYIGIGLHKEFIGYSINDIFTITIYLILFGLMILGIYKAYNKKLFKIGETINYKNNKKILDITSDGNFNEKDKLTIIISKIPILGFIIYPKYQKNKLIESNNKVNVIVTILIMLLYIIGNSNLANIILLFYIIFIVFSAINLFVKNEIIHINANNIVKPKDIVLYIKSLYEYMINYFQDKKNFKEFKYILNKKSEEINNQNQNEFKTLEKLENFKLWKYIIYIPIINLICLFNLNCRQKLHIINGVLISTLILILWSIYGIDNKYWLILIIPISFGIGNLRSGIMFYKIPLLYDLLEILIEIKNNIFNIFKKVNNEKNINLKVKNKDE